MRSCRRQLSRHWRNGSLESPRHWLNGREPRRADGTRVMLWPDTFNNYFRPATAIAATQVLEGLGFHVVIPEQPLCCGRPLYDWGRLDRAKERWRHVMTTLRTDIERSTPIIGLEPACVSAFRDELPGLFPNDSAAQRLATQTLFFTEFLDQHAPDKPLPRTAWPALVQIHCHHHAVIKPTSEKRVLDLFHHPEEIREVHDAGHVRFRELNPAGDGKFGRQNAACLGRRCDRVKCISN